MSPQILPEIDREALEFILSSAQVGLWDVELVAPWTVIWDDRCKELFGIAKNNTIPYHEVIKFIHDDDRLTVDNAVKAALDPNGDGAYNMTYRTIGIDDGKVRWVNFTGKAYFKDGIPYRFAGIARDVTRDKENQQELITTKSLIKELVETKSNFRNIVEQAPIAIALLKGREMILETANDYVLDIWGKDKSIIGQPLIKGIPELEGQPFMSLMEQVFDTGEPYYAYASKAQLKRKGKLEDVYSDFVYTPVKAGDGHVTGVMILAMIVTEQVLAKQKLEKSEARFRSLIEEASVASCLFTGKDMITELANKMMLRYWGKNSSAIGLPLRVAVPELIGQPFLDILDHVYTTGESHFGYETECLLEVDGVLGTYYFDFTYKALREISGEIYGVMNTSIDVTEKVMARRKLEEAEVRLLEAIEVAELGTWDLDPATNTFIGNTRLKEWFGLSSETEIPLNLALDVIHEKDKERVTAEISNAIQYNSGGIYDIQYTIVNPATGKERIVRAKGKTSFDENLIAYRFNGTLEDITEQVIARKRVEEAEESLLNAVEIAELGTWSILLDTGILDYSERLREWFGIGKDEIITIERAYSPIVESDREKVRLAILHSITPGTNNIYDVEYHVKSEIGNRERIIHALGKAFFNKDGVAYRIAGTATDVTRQRQLELALKYEVQRRTEELAASNEELTAINEELLSSTDRIMQSNQQLAQYAYIASHDLQEPLRKIQVYSNMLESQEGLTEQNKMAVSKINKSSHRMTLLIKALLEFSSLQNSDQMYVSVNLADVINEILIDFELTIEEKNAVINISSELPVLDGIPLQMNQLFYNLINNALKFINNGDVPVIQISCTALTTDETKKFIPRLRKDLIYYDITITDNGIGFDSQYYEQIFEVFKRLHTRDVYPGSGIGLALCRKIVNHHCGYMYAESEVGKGAKFHVILPNKHIL